MPTDTERKFNVETGLYENQEQACILLAKGERVSAVANDVKVSESTIRAWQKEPAFICYYNRQRSERQNIAVQSLFGLVDEAVAALRESLSSINEATKLKAATYILDKLSAAEVGQTDIIELVKAEATYADDWAEEPHLHEAEYKARLKKLGVRV